MEILVICLVFSVLLNIVQALSGEFHKGYSLGKQQNDEFCGCPERDYNLNRLQSK